MAEKSVIASISQAEERHFKTLQLPALRAVVCEPAPQKRRFFLLLYFQPVGSPSILGENVFQQSSPAFAHGPDKARRQLFVGTDATPPPFARHSGSHGQIRAVFSAPGDGVLFVNNIVILALSKSAFLILVLRPPVRPKVGPGFCPEPRPAYSQMRCLPLRRRSQRSKVGLNIRRDVALCTVRKWEFPILLYMDPTLNRVGRFCGVSSKIKFIYILHLKER